MTPEPGGEVRLILRPPGVIVPGWIALVFALALLFSALGFLLSLYFVADLREDNQLLRDEMKESLTNQTKEVRILQLHVQDIQSLMIQQGNAKRQDFAPWPADAPTHDVNRDD